MNPEIVIKIEEAALKYAVEDNDRRGYVKGHCGATKDGFSHGARFGYSLAGGACDAGERARFIQAQANLIQSLQSELRAADREIDILRRYGNKDCTAMADDQLKIMQECQHDNRGGACCIYCGGNT